MAVLSRNECVRDGWLVIRNGKIVRIATRAPRGIRVLESGGNVVIPGLVNAHCHLRFSHLKGELRGGQSFTNWIRGILGARPPELNIAIRAAREMVSSGVTAAGDFDPDGFGARLLHAAGLAGVAYREFFAFDPATALAAAGAAARAGRKASADYKPRIVAGLAPHSPYTVAHPALAATHSQAVSMHFMETAEEREFVKSGEGPIELLLSERGRIPGFPIPRMKPVEFIQKARLFQKGASLVHCNALTRPELGALASDGRFIAIHCPGTHRSFRRGASPVSDWIRAKLQFALGTDSLASNSSLDMFCEMELLKINDPRIAPEAIFEAATETGARALRLRGRGVLRQGSHADFVSLTIDLNTRQPERFLKRTLFDALVSRPKVAGVFLAGNRAQQTTS